MSGFCQLCAIYEKMASDCSDPEYGIDMIKDSSVKQY